MKIRIDINANYKAIFFNGKTIRQRIDNSKPILTPQFAEIEDVAINDKCFAACSYCYTSAKSTGINFESIVEKSNNVWGIRSQNDRPFQIAIGGAGESTIHPDWVEFVKTVSSFGIVPNYTTNGMHLSEKLLEATEEYCGGVAVSYHPHIQKVFDTSLNKLSEIKTMLNVHLIIGDEKSLIDAKNIFERWKYKVKYFVMLPYQAVGRGKEIEVKNTWKEMFVWINSLSEEEKNKFAFGALFYPYLQRNEIDLDIDVYEPEIYSGYRIFDDSYMNLRISSYNINYK